MKNITKTQPNEAARANERTRAAENIPAANEKTMPDTYYLQNAHKRVQTLVEHITKLTLARDILARECSEAQRAFDESFCKETDSAIFARKVSEKLTGAGTRIATAIEACEAQLAETRRAVESETRIFDTQKRNEEFNELLAFRAQFERVQNATEGMLK